MSDIVSFGEWVQTRRNQLRLSRPELARQIHCSPVTIKKIERDERRPSPELAQLLATHLQIPEAEQDDFVRRARGEFISEMRSPAEMLIVEAQSVPANGQPPQHNLPQRLTSFIGRKQEIETISTLVMEHRLVMLTGVGGIGKTNLSLQVGRAVLASFSDGVWFVELAPLTDPQLIAQTAVSALDLPDSPNQPPLQTLRNFLQEKSCLLILDNCEHLINDVAQFAQTLLQHCPDLKILASSREALGVPGEMPFSVPPLSIPEATQTLALDEWQQYDALRLFVDRATAVLPHFQVTNENIAPLIQICHQLDGIPLALELAAARVKILSTAQIAERLNDRFRLLTGGKRTALPRQQTLRALIDWSWELLTEREQLLLQRLSVFAGGMDMEAIELVCVGDGLDEYDILDLSAELVNKSLLVSLREQGKRPRYYLLETIRQYGQERLLMAGQEDRFRQQHLDYYWQLSQKAEQALVGPDQVAWMNRLDEEWDNIRVALNWANETNVERGLQLTTSLWRLWFLRGSISEADVWLTRLLASSEQLKPTIRAKSLLVQGHINKDMVKTHYARQLVEESLYIYQSLEDPNGIALCLLHLAMIADWLGERENAQSLYNNSLAIYRQLEDKVGLAELLVQIGAFASNALNEYEQAAAYLHEAYSLQKELAHLHGAAFASTELGKLALNQGDYHTAKTWLEESLAYQDLLQDKLVGGLLSNILGHLYFRLNAYDEAQYHLEKSALISKQSGHNVIYYWGQVILGYCFLGQGELEKTETIFIESQQQFKKSDQISGVVFATEGLAILATRRQQPKLATRLFAWADATREAIQDPRPLVEQADVDRHIVMIKEMIDEQTFNTVYAEGQTLTMDQAIAYAIGAEE